MYARMCMRGYLRAIALASIASFMYPEGTMYTMIATQLAGCTLSSPCQVPCPNTSWLTSLAETPMLSIRTPLSTAFVRTSFR